MKPILYPICYLIGSISFPALYAKAIGIDLYKKRGHFGASALYLATNKIIPFIVCGGLDVAKGALAYKIAGIWGSFFALLGHIFSIFLKFKGGNGVSVYYGTVLMLNPLLPFLCGVVEVLVSFLTRKLDIRIKQAIHLTIRALPLSFFKELFPLYILLLAKHIYFFYFRKPYN